MSQSIECDMTMLTSLSPTTAATIRAAARPAEASVACVALQELQRTHPLAPQQPTDFDFNCFACAADAENDGCEMETCVV